MNFSGQGDCFYASLSVSFLNDDDGDHDQQSYVCDGNCQGLLRFKGQS
jgi:hypothetical protein